MFESAREEILSKIKVALKHDSARNAAAASNEAERLHPQTDETREQNRGNLLTQFEVELKLAGAHFYSAASASAACEYVRKLASSGVKSIVGWDSELIREIALAETLNQAGVAFIPDAGKLSSAEFISKATEADIGITAVDYALAETGTLVALTGKGRARAVSLLPPIHVALVKPEQVISGLADLFALLRVEKGFSSRNVSSAVTFITGPSRTADIELTLVVGVHGPQQLHVILLND
jgi:L-lactate dehydrogenase complex protein LldG